MRHLTRRLETRYRCRDKAAASPREGRSGRAMVSARRTHSQAFNLTDRAKTQPSFHTAFFCSLFRGLRASRIPNLAKNFDLRDGLQFSADFSHGLLKFRIVTRSSKRASDREPGPAARYDIQSTPTGQTFDPDDALALDVVDLSVLVVVVVISAAAMIVPVIGRLNGHLRSICRA
jgi:hypothetical protein